MPGPGRELGTDQPSLAEGLDHPDPDRRLLDGGGEVALLVLDPAGHEPVAAPEGGRHQHQGGDGRGRQQGQGQVQPGQQGDHQNELRRAHDKEHQAEGEEASDRAYVPHGPRQHLARLPPVVKAHVQALEVLVEGVPQVALETGGARGHDEAPSDGQAAVDHTEQEGEPGQRGEFALAPALDGPVDDPLDHQRYEHARHHSS